MTQRFGGIWILAALGAMLAGCGGNAAAPSPNALRGVTPASASSPSPIQHIVVMVQENRTFNNFFAQFPGADGTTTAKVAANPNCSPPIKKGTIALTEANLVLAHDLDHRYRAFQTAVDHGKMDGFDRAKFSSGLPECAYPYMYTDPSQIAPYWDMAEQYTLAEHMFTTQGSDSFSAHQDLITGGTVVAHAKNGVGYVAMVDLPTCNGPLCWWGCDSTSKTRTHLVSENNIYIPRLGPFPCTTDFSVNYPSMAQVLDAQYVSWKYYVPPANQTYGRQYSAFDVIASVRYGSDWTKDVITPQIQIYNDIANRSLAAVSWVIPDQPDSDHPGDTEDDGPSWVASVVNEIGESSYWNSTAIIIVWDDWGGLYDNERGQSLNYGGLGLRVPAIIVSPYAKAGYISPTDYEFGSILKYIEQNFDLASLGTSDARATSIIDCFDYNQSPIPFTVIPSAKTKEYFIHRKPTFLPNDDY